MGAHLADGRAAAFFDVDGTLIWRDPDAMHKLSSSSEDATELVMGECPTEATYDAFRRMRENGHATFICTGRPLFLLQQGIRDLEPTGYIASAGAYVRIGDEVVRDDHIPYELLMEAAQVFFDAGINIEIEGNERNVALYSDDQRSLFPRTVTAHSVEELEPHVRRYHFAKFCAHNMTAERIEPVRAYCEGRFTVCNMQLNSYEFSPIGLDKGSGIRAALAHVGIDASRAYAFGDSENDLSMTEAVGTFVAMGNALPHVKECADYVTDDVRDDGVATGLAHFGLI